MTVIEGTCCNGPQCSSAVKYALTITLVGCFWLTIAAAPAQSAERALLLVSGVQTESGAFTHAELRKIYLGVPVTRDDVRIRPLINTSDPLAFRIFLQHVLFMSERDYRRQLLLRVFQRGGIRPAEHKDMKQLVENLESEQGTLTFMWSDQFDREEGLKSLGVIWESSND